jgi:hypothetical protein
MKKINPSAREGLDLTRGLAAAFGGPASEEDQERESPSIPGLSRS